VGGWVGIVEVESDGKRVCGDREDTRERVGARDGEKKNGGKMVSEE